MRILQVSHRLYPERLGGVEIQCYELSKALSRSHDVWVFTGAAVSTGDSFREGFHVRAVQPDRVGRADFAAWVQALQPDIVHFQHLVLGNGYRTAVGLLQAVRQLGIPSVVSLHDYWYACARGTLVHSAGERCSGPAPSKCAQCAPWPTKNPVRYLVRRRHYRHRERALFEALAEPVLVAASQHVGRRYAGFGLPPAHIVVVTPGVAITPSNGTEDRPAGDGEMTVAFLGRLEPEKGAHVLLEAFGRLPGLARLEVWGTGHHVYTARLKEKSGQLRHRVDFRGAYDYHALPAILAGIDVVVVPSIWEEAYGLVTSEALARRKIVVASHIAGLTEIVRDGVNGFLVPPGDPTRLADTLAAIGADVGGAHARLTFAPEVKSIDAQAAELTRLYGSVLRHPSSPARAIREFHEQAGEPAR